MAPGRALLLEPGGGALEGVAVVGCGLGDGVSGPGFDGSGCATEWAHSFSKSSCRSFAN